MIDFPMTSQKKDLISDSVFDYLYICFFMFTYRKTKNKFFNKIIFDKISSLRATLELKGYNIKTIITHRKELVESFNQKLFIDNVTVDDSIDLRLIFSSFRTLYDIALSEEFLDTIDTIQPIIAKDVEALSPIIVKYFTKIDQSDDPFYTQDSFFILVLVLDFLKEYYLSDYTDVLTELKERILSDVLAKKFQVDNYVAPTPNQQPQTLPDFTMPPELVELLTLKESFIIIQKGFKLIEYGNVDKIRPVFELNIRKYFPKGYLPTKDLKEALLKTFEWYISDTQFRLSIRHLLEQKGYDFKKKSANVDERVSKTSNQQVTA